MQTKYIVRSLFLLSFFVNPFFTNALNPTINTFTVTESVSAPGQIYDVTYDISNIQQPSNTIVNVACNPGLKVRKFREGEDEIMFPCGNPPEVANSFQKSSQSKNAFSFMFTNTTNQPINESITLSTNGLQPVTKYVIIPGQGASAFSAPKLDKFEITAATALNDNPNRYSDTYSISFGLKVTSPINKLSVTADCPIGLKLQYAADGFVPIACPYIFSLDNTVSDTYYGVTRVIRFINSSSKTITESITFSADGIQPITKYITIPPSNNGKEITPVVPTKNIQPSTKNTTQPIETKNKCNIDTKTFKTLSLGVKNNNVRTIQERLKSLNYLSSSPTGYYGKETTNAVKMFQKDKKLPITGTVGPMTLQVLNSLCATLLLSNLENSNTQSVIIPKTVTNQITKTPIVTASFSPASLPINSEFVNFNWNSSNSTYCTLTYPDGSPMPNQPVYGTYRMGMSSFSVGEVKRTVTCYNSTGQSVSQTAVLTVTP